MQIKVSNSEGRYELTEQRPFKLTSVVKVKLTSVFQLFSNAAK